MDRQERQDRNQAYDAIIEDIIGCAFEIARELGHGFLESVYEKSMLIALADRCRPASAQYPIEVRFRGKSVGHFFADLLVEEKVVIELKVCKSIAPEHEAQLINYLQATGIEVGLIINFGTPRAQVKRCTRTK